VQYVFQNPYRSLTRHHTVGATLREPLRVHRIVRNEDLDAEVARLLAMVDLPADLRGRYPHELSGGQRQRLAIARALTVRPTMLVADEPVGALDVLAQREVTNTLLRLKRDHNQTLVFVSHDVGWARKVATRVAVMYQGQLVETGSSQVLMDQATHPYTKRLLRADPLHWDGMTLDNGGDRDGAAS